MLLLSSLNELFQRKYCSCGLLSVSILPIHFLFLFVLFLFVCFFFKLGIRLLSTLILILFFYFNWRLVTLQYCGGFAIYSHESAMGVHVFPSWPSLASPSPSHFSGSSQCTSPKHSASSIKPGLAINYTYVNIHIPMLFSQIIPPSPSPTESNSLFFTSVSLWLSRV